MTKEYKFILKYKLPSSKIPTDEIVNMLYANGCDDALIGTGLSGYITCNFSRKAENIFAAIQSANQDVLKTVPKAELIGWVTDYCAEECK